MLKSKEPAWCKCKNWPLSLSQVAVLEIIRASDYVAGSGLSSRGSEPSFPRRTAGLGELRWRCMSSGEGRVRTGGGVPKSSVLET